jgi:hypothetical protein
MRDDIDTVILAARWPLSVTGERYRKEGGGRIVLVDHAQGEYGGGREIPNAALVERGLRRTLLALEALGKRVLVVKPIPEVGYDVPSVNHIAWLTGRDINALIAPTFREYLARNHESLQIIDKMVQEFGVAALQPASLLCEGSVCRLTDARGVAIYRDDDHLSTFGSKYVAQVFDVVF